ncbi:RDD family protein [Herbiconiux solani]|uniref:RDD family protein n=1 Tax=Herbiconiux solani TaxID=661329 RepID=UPI000825297C|nr:RDD family protein [Herbiconiux solani]
MTQPFAGGSGTVVDDGELISGEAVALDVRPASFLLRSASGGIDFVVYVGGYLLSVLAFSALLQNSGIDPAATQALFTSLLVLWLVIAPITVEVATRGKSLGKLAIGARIVRDDGGAASLRHAVIRGLTGVVEIYLTLGGLAFVVSLLNSRSKRLGDLLAGTYSQHERVARPVPFTIGVPPELAGWAEVADVAKLPDRLSRRVTQYLTQAGAMNPATAGRLAEELARETAPYVSPLPNVHPYLFLVAVAAVRRDREYRALVLERERLARVDPILKGLPNGFPDR